MAYAKALDGESIYYEAHGTTGAAVILIQGLGLSSRFWFDMPERLVRAGYRAIVLDNRGVGRSHRPRRPFTMGTMADDVAEVLDTVGVDTAHVVGISMGGMIAQHVALRHPARVRSLVLMATTPGLPHGRLPPPTVLGTLVSVGTNRRGRAGMHLAGLLLPKKDMSRAAELMKDWPAAFRADAPSGRAFLTQLAAVATHSTGARLRSIRCPTAVVTGDQDVLVPPQNSRILARAIAGAHLEVIPDCGHGIPITDEDVVERALERVAR